ncbi:MAG: molybdopterin-dependent oxidoreductase [Planctomycetota bacterium]
MTYYLLLTLILIAALCTPLRGGYCLDPPPITPNNEFFILGRAPEIPPDWTLDIDGEVEQPLSLSLDELRQYPHLNVEATLECDYSSGPLLLVDNAVWSGVSIKSLLDRAVLKPSASSITFWALDGYRRGPWPLGQFLYRTDVLVAHGMNAEPLPEIQGWPVRLVLPGHVGNEWVRWLDRIEISSASASDRFQEWPIHARILEPDYNAIIDECPCTIKGMVNAGNGKEITKIQVSTDNGATWESAELLNYFTPNIWKHWQYEWKVETPGQYTIFARVIDEDGDVQDEDRPYGWWGYRVVVTVSPEVNCVDPQRADINKDLYVDFIDFSLLADQWLMNSDGLSADLMPDEGDGKVGIQDLVLIADKWLDCLVPTAADPLPADGEEDVGLTPELVWQSQDGSIHYDVYFGVDACSVTAATYGSEEFLGSVVDNILGLDRILEHDTVYYWRIDQIGPRCVALGNVWSFKTTSDFSMPSE